MKKNNAQIDNAEDIEIVRAMYNLRKYSDNYSKPSGRLWQYYRDEPFLNANKNVSLNTYNKNSRENRKPYHKMC